MERDPAFGGVPLHLVDLRGADLSKRKQRFREIRAIPRNQEEPRTAGLFNLVDLRGIEPLTFSLRTRRATNCATDPYSDPL